MQITELFSTFSSLFVHFLLDVFHSLHTFVIGGIKFPNSVGIFAPGHHKLLVRNQWAKTDTIKN